MNPIAEDIMMHYGVARRSGRYPWGSGEDPYQRNKDFLSRVEKLKNENFTFTDENGKKWTGENAIAKSMGLTIGEYRYEKSICKDQRRMLDVARAKSLKADGLGATEIGKMMGINESTVRSLLDSKAEERMQQTKETVDFLRAQVDEKKMIDVGTSVDKELNISKERLNTALYYLTSKEGYHVYSGGIPQPTNPGQQTTQKVLCVPGTKHSEIYDYSKVKTINEYVSHDDGKTFDKFVYPKSMDSKRLMVRYAEDGGIDKDGIVELRRGVPDLSLGGDHYSQVRILVDDKKYIKGMAVYADDKDMPPGVDVIFNTNKTKDKGKLEVLKDIGNDPDNPFGSLIKAGGQSYYTDKDGNKQLSLINKRASEGDWTDWKDALPSQFLGKQTLSLAKRQLNIAKADKMDEYKSICELENPTIKKHLLQKFSDNCDSAAVHLQAAALPGQKYHVIIPVNTLKDNEIFAPKYDDGTQLALIRYPHGGKFEIPIVTVNNKHAAARKLIGIDAEDAVGINKNVADRLSGADFDGDTVMCIPTNDGKVRISAQPELDGLKGFDPKLAYPERPGMRYMKDPVTGTDNTQMEMGVISNLITDMTLGGANNTELAAAVRHSMVVIDAGKHKLDYKQSEIDNNIASLKHKYQIKYDKNGNLTYGGAATLLSRAKGETQVDRRQGTPKINQKGKEWYDPSKPEGAYIYKKSDDLYYVDAKFDRDSKTRTVRTVDGKKITYDTTDKKAVEMYEPIKKVDKKTGEVTYTNKAGDIEYRTKTKKQASTNMAETDDARTLISKGDYPMERVYAEYANSMKALANQARKEMVSTGKIEFNKEAKARYQPEVKSLMDKLTDARLNAVREREALRLANVEIAAKKAANPNMKAGDVRKISQQAISKYRNEVGAIARRDRNIDITDREWEAIQAGAISETKLKQILNNTDIDKLRERATPRRTTTVSPAVQSRIKAMSSSNLTIAQIAKATGVSPSTVSEYLKGVK